MEEGGGKMVEVRMVKEDLEGMKNGMEWNGRDPYLKMEGK